MDTEFLKFLTSLGVGGVLAGVIFYFHQKTADRHKSDLKDIIARQQSREDALLRKLDENTTSNTRLITVIDALQALVARELSSRRAME